MVKGFVTVLSSTNCQRQDYITKVISNQQILNFYIAKAI